MISNGARSSGAGTVDAQAARSGEDDDAALLERLRRGSAGATQSLYQRYGSEVNRMVLRILGPDAEHDDVVNETFLKILRSVHQVRDPSRLKAWIQTTTVNTTRSWLRKRMVLRRAHGVADIEERFTGVRRSPEAVHLVTRVNAVLSQLAPRHRVAFALRHCGQLELAQVAQLCGCSLATIKRRLAKAEHKFLLLARKEPALAELLADVPWSRGR